VDAKNGKGEGNLHYVHHEAESQNKHQSIIGLYATHDIF